MVKRMRTDPRDDPVLQRFRAAVGDAYGDRLERVVLYGSRARGDHKPDSDYDIAVFIYDPNDLWDELGVICKITIEILLDSDTDISAKPFHAGSYRATSLFMSELRRDGLDL
jgi:predicted nucleotidyltransferase